MLANKPHFSFIRPHWSLLQVCPPEKFQTPSSRWISAKTSKKRNTWNQQIQVIWKLRTKNPMKTHGHGFFKDFLDPRKTIRTQSPLARPHCSKVDRQNAPGEPKKSPSDSYVWKPVSFSSFFGLKTPLQNKAKIPSKTKGPHLSSMGMEDVNKKKVRLSTKWGPTRQFCEGFFILFCGMVEKNVARTSLTSNASRLCWIHHPSFLVMFARCKYKQPPFLRAKKKTTNKSHRGYDLCYPSEHF